MRRPPGWRSSCGTSRPATGRSGRCSASRSRCRREACARCSGPTAPARRPWHGWRPASSRRRRGPSGSPAPMSPVSPPGRLARLGVAHAVEGRSVFASLSVEDNLRLSFRRSVGAAGVDDALQRAYAGVPSPRRAAAAGSGDALGRRAAHAGAGTSPRRSAVGAHRRRAVARSGARHRRRGLCDARNHPRRGDLVAHRRAAGARAPSGWPTSWSCSGRVRCATPGPPTRSATSSRSCCRRPVSAMLVRSPPAARESFRSTKVDAVVRLESSALRRRRGLGRWRDRRARRGRRTSCPRPSTGH